MQGRHEGTDFGAQLTEEKSWRWECLVERGRNDKEAGHVSPRIFEVRATEGKPEERENHQL